ncbi:MAG: PepSY domain-containing protein [Pirellulales bacterium]
MRRLWAPNGPTEFDANKLSAAIDAVTKQGYTQITEAALDNGYWEIDAMQGNTAVELQVDPQTGRVLRVEPESRRPLPPKDGPTADRIVRDLEAAGFMSFTEVDYEGTHWEVEASRGGVRREVIVDVLSGKVISDRTDPE